MEPDHYAVLQVDPRAESEVIEAAYRKLATKYHPDRNSAASANDRMKLINAAYEVLRDPERRMAYDRRRGLSSGGWIPPGDLSGGRIIPWRTLSLILVVVILVALGVLVRFNPRYLLTVAALLFVAWTVHMMRTPRRD